MQSLFREVLLPLLARRASAQPSSIRCWCQIGSSVVKYVRCRRFAAEFEWTDCSAPVWPRRGEKIVTFRPCNRSAPLDKSRVPPWRVLSARPRRASFHRSGRTPARRQRDNCDTYLPVRAVARSRSNCQPYASQSSVGFVSASRRLFFIAACHFDRATKQQQLEADDFMRVSGANDRAPRRRTEAVASTSGGVLFALRRNHRTATTRANIFPAPQSVTFQLAN